MLLKPVNPFSNFVINHRSMTIGVGGGALTTGMVAGVVSLFFLVGWSASLLGGGALYASIAGGGSAFILFGAAGAIFLVIKKHSMSHQIRRIAIENAKQARITTAFYNACDADQARITRAFFDTCDEFITNVDNSDFDTPEGIDSLSKIVSRLRKYIEGKDLYTDSFLRYDTFLEKPNSETGKLLRKLGNEIDNHYYVCAHAKKIQKSSDRDGEFNKFCKDVKIIIKKIKRAVGLSS